MTHSVARYQPSGFFRPTAILLTLGATVAGVALSWLYAFACRKIPFIQLNLIITVGFGFALGAMVATGLRIGHCRNRALAVVLTLPAVLIPLAASYWFNYQSVLSSVVADGGESFSFRQYLDVAQRIGWSISNHGSSSSKVDGWMVDAVWAGEALLVLGTALGLALTQAMRPYCETCNEWGTPHTLAIGGRDRGDVKPLLEANDIDALVALTRTEGGDARALSYSAMICSRCSDTGFLTIEEVLVIRRGKKANTKKTKLIRNATLNPRQRAQLLARIASPAPARTAPPPQSISG